jgi:hypothetical protein
VQVVYRPVTPMVTDRDCGAETPPGQKYLFLAAQLLAAAAKLALN